MKIKIFKILRLFIIMEVSKNNYYKVRKTVIEMLRDRGNEISEKYEIPFDEFVIQYDNDGIDMVIELEDKIIYVYFHVAEKNLSKKEFVNLIERTTKEYENLHLIIITPSKLNQTLKKEIKKLEHCEAFLTKELLFNITKHTLIPEMRMLNEKEIKKVIEKFRVPANKLPKFLLTDPIVRYYGGKTGDVFEIKRISLGSGVNVTYRYVK